MAQNYRFVGSQDPASRIDRVIVEDATEENPDGKILLLDGDPVELSNDQYSKLAMYVQLEPVTAQAGPVGLIVDQPGVEMTSRSTAAPPDLGTAPDVGALNKSELIGELERVRRSDPDALSDVSTSSSKDDLQKALRKYHGQEA
jgi:hypothetical protein